MNPLQLCLDFLAEVTGGPAPPAADECATPVPRYELRRSPRRRTLGIEVHPDLRVVVRAPARCQALEIELFLAERADWVETQLAYFRTQPPAPGPGFSDGEVQRYLGDAYRLRLRPAATPGIRINAAELVIGGPEARSMDAARQALMRWWRERAAVEFTMLLDVWHQHPRFARYPRPALNIRAMRTRWGSLGSRRGITLNLALIQAPRACIEYVVVHELCHLRYHGHGRGFYRLLDAVMPDWRARKQALEASVR